MYTRQLGVASEIGTAVWQANGMRTVLLNRENEVKSYKLRFEVTHDNGTTPALSLTDLFDMIVDLRIVAGGKNNIKIVNGIKMYINYLKNHGVLPHYSIDTTASTADLTSWVIIEVPMCMFDMQRPIDTIFPTNQYINLDLKITFAGATDVGTNVTVTDGLVTVIEDGIENFNRDYDFRFFKELYTSKVITTTNLKEQIVLPTETMYKQLTFVSRVDGALSDAMIGGVTIRSGGKIIKQLSAKEIKETMLKNSQKATEADFKGFLVIDFAERGHVTEFIDTRRNNGGFLQLTAEFEATAVGTVNRVDLYSDYFEEISLVEKA